MTFTSTNVVFRTGLLFSVFALFFVGQPTLSFGKSTSAVFSCVSLTSCSEQGHCVYPKYTLHFIETHELTTSNGSKFQLNGPLLGSAGGGSFWEQPFLKVQNVKTFADVFSSEQITRSIPLLIQKSTDPGDTAIERTYYYIRPAKEIPRLRGEIGATEFVCNQVLFD